MYQEIRKEMCYFHEGWHSLFLHLYLLIFSPTDALYELLSELIFFDTSVFKTLLKMHVLFSIVWSEDRPGVDHFTWKGN